MHRHDHARASPEQEGDPRQPFCLPTSRRRLSDAHPGHSEAEELQRLPEGKRWSRA